MSAAQIQQKTILFSGAVQGVGFRYTTQRIAGNHTVAGTVRNLSDGSVELVVEGATEEVASFLAEVREHFRGNITDQTETSAPGTGRYRSFDILR